MIPKGITISEIEVLESWEYSFSDEKANGQKSRE